MEKRFNLSEQNWVSFGSGACSAFLLKDWVYGKRKSKSVKLDAAAPVFEEIKLTGDLALQSWAAEVSLPSGLAVRFSAAATPAWIGSVVKGLPRRC